MGDRELDEIKERNELEERAAKLPPGTVGIPCRVLSAYSVFTHSMANLVMPPGSKVSMVAGPNIENNHNQFIRAMTGEWMWFMGDDHEFQEDVLLRLLERDVDVVVPLCMRRLPPFQLVLYKSEHEGSGGPAYEYVFMWDLPLDGGLFEVHAAGTAGMLVRRHVLDAIEQPWFTTSHGLQNEDLEFCRKVREAGFKIWADADVYVGHVATCSVRPQQRIENGTRHWGYCLEFAPGDDIFIVPNRPAPKGLVLPEHVQSDILVPGPTR